MPEFFNMPGVFVIQEMLPEPLTPQLPDQPAAIIGPLYSIVEQEVDTKTDAVLYVGDITNDNIPDVGLLDHTYDDVGDTYSGFQDFTVNYPTLITGAPIDIKSVKTEIVKPDGRRFELSNEHFTAGANDGTEAATGTVDIPLSVETTYTEFFRINDSILGRPEGWSIENNDMSGLNGSYIHLSYRIAREDLVGRVLKVQGPEGAQMFLNKACLENPLGLAGLLTTSIAPNVGIMFVPTKDYLSTAEEASTGGATEETEVSNALAALETENSYAIVVLSSTPASHQKNLNHCNAMSDPEEKKYRIAYTYYKMPNQNADGSYDQAILDYNGGSQPLNMSDLKRIQSEILHLYGKSVYDRRCHILFQDFVITLDGEDVELPGYYLAAMTAAYKSSLPPEQGMTNYPVPAGVKKLLYDNRYFKPSQLNHISLGGIYVYTQTVENAPIKCLGQWTSNMSSNKTKQSSLIWSVDLYSKTMIETLDPITGVNNITDDGVLENVIETIGGVNSVFMGNMIDSAEIISAIRNKYDSARYDVIIEPEFATPLDKIVIRLRF